MHWGRYGLTILAGGILSVPVVSDDGEIIVAGRFRYVLENLQHCAGGAC